jgi:DNA-binding NarL/FixJ family response regulator
MTPQRERILAMLARGCPQKTIAAELKVTERYIRQVVRILKNEFGVDSIAELVSVGTKRGLLK